MRFTSGQCLSTQVVAVVEDDSTHFLHIQHSTYVRNHRIQRSLDISLRVTCAQFLGFTWRETCWNVAIQGVVRGCLVGHQVGDDATAHEFGVDLGGIAN
jgi:hypothetical protein